MRVDLIVCTEAHTDVIAHEEVPEAEGKHRALLIDTTIHEAVTIELGGELTLERVSIVAPSHEAEGAIGQSVAHPHGHHDIAGIHLDTLVARVVLLLEVLTLIADGHIFGLDGGAKATDIVLQSEEEGEGACRREAVREVQSHVGRPPRHEGRDLLDGLGYGGGQSTTDVEAKVHAYTEA